MTKIRESREKVQNLNLNALNLFGMHILLVIQKLYKYWFGPFETRKKIETRLFVR